MRDDRDGRASTRGPASFPAAMSDHPERWRPCPGCGTPVGNYGTLCGRCTMLPALLYPYTPIPKDLVPAPGSDPRSAREAIDRAAGIARSAAGMAGGMTRADRRTADELFLGAIAEAERRGREQDAAYVRHRDRFARSRGGGP